MLRYDPSKLREEDFRANGFMTIEELYNLCEAEGAEPIAVEHYLKHYYDHDGDCNTDNLTCFCFAEFISHYPYFNPSTHLLKVATWADTPEYRDEPHGACPIVRTAGFASVIDVDLEAHTIFVAFPTSYPYPHEVVLVTDVVFKTLFKLMRDYAQLTTDNIFKVDDSISFYPKEILDKHHDEIQQAIHGTLRHNQKGEPINN